MKFTSHREFGDIFPSFDRVVVTGPQRSGTKIVSNIISIDTGFDLIRHTKMTPPIYIDLFKQSKNIVLHNPSYVAFLEDIQDEKTAIVYCWRNLEDIIASETKWSMNSDGGMTREMAYLLWKGYIDSMKIVNKEINPAKEKNDLWRDIIADKLINAFTVRYEDLHDHPLWVSKEERSKFTSVNQVSSDGDIYRVNRQKGKTK